MCNTYENNHPYGSAEKPVIFTCLKKGFVNCEEVDIIVSNHEFFEDLKCSCDDDYRNFYGVFAFCAPFGDCRPVFIQDGCNCKLIPLRSRFGGFSVHLDQIQYLCNARKLVSLSNCYDGSNDHVNIITPIAPKHKKCFCNCCNKDYENNDNDASSVDNNEKSNDGNKKNKDNINNNSNDKDKKVD